MSVAEFATILKYVNACENIGTVNSGLKLSVQPLVMTTEKN